MNSTDRIQELLQQIHTAQMELELMNVYSHIYTVDATDVVGLLDGVTDTPIQELIDTHGIDHIRETIELVFSTDCERTCRPDIDSLHDVEANL